MFMGSSSSWRSQHGTHIHMNECISNNCSYLFKVVRVILVGKNVHKELARGFQKAVHLVHQVIVILHVFKHFNRHDAVIVFDDTQCALIVSDIALYNIEKKDRFKKVSRMKIDNSKLSAKNDNSNNSMYVP
jgi:hypothetical protein